VIRSIASLTILILLVSTGLLSCGKLNFDPQKSPDGFSPESISGLSFWLRADKKINVSSGLVADWTDAVASIQLNGPSGQGASYISTDGEFNGNPSVGFTGRPPGSIFILSNLSASIPALCQSGYTVVMIMKPALITDPVPFSVFFAKNNSNQTLVESKLSYAASEGHKVDFYLVHPATSSTSLYGFESQITPYPSGVTIQGIHYAGGASSKVFRDGVISQGLNTLSATVGPVGCSSLILGLGLVSSDSNYSGTDSVKVAEIMIYDWALDDDSFRALGCYAKKKYGISNYLGSCN
jgi:hypothetical protein